MEIKISEELNAGIARVAARKNALVHELGGFGTRVTGEAPNGETKTGRLVDSSTSDQGPYLQDADGKRWRVEGLRRADAE